MTSYRVTNLLRHTALYYITNPKYLIIANHLSASGLRLAPHLTHASSGQCNDRGASDSRHAKVFGEKEAQKFPGPRLWDHAIELKPNTPATIPGKIYALTQKEQLALTKFIQEHLQKGYIKPSKRPYASPFFFIKKKDGKLQPIQDYGKVNEWTIKNRYPLPLISELIARVKGAKLFTKFDVQWGYNNVRIKEGDRWKAAFITNQGLYEPIVMFFGLTNSPATFQTMMNIIFAEEVREGWLTIYMDNMLIHTTEDIQHHCCCIH